MRIVLAIVTGTLLVIVGGVVALSGVIPGPQPSSSPSILPTTQPITESSREFFLPFEYTIPAGDPMTVTAAHFGTFRFAEAGGGVDVFWNSGYIHPCNPGEPDPYADYSGTPSGVHTVAVDSRPVGIIALLPLRHRAQVALRRGPPAHEGSAAMLGAPAT